MNLLGKLRVYANRCPHCGQRMRFYSWHHSPISIPVLTTLRLCPGRHYMRLEHVATGVVEEHLDIERPLSRLAGITEFPDPDRLDKAIHQNLNVPARKYGKAPI